MFKPSVSTDLSSVLTQLELLLSALFSELSQGVKEEHITAEDGSSLSGLAQEQETGETLALCNEVVDTRLMLLCFHSLTVWFQFRDDNIYFLFCLFIIAKYKLLRLIEHIEVLPFKVKAGHLKFNSKVQLAFRTSVYCIVCRTLS